MRRVLRRQLPALTRCYGIAPWDVDRLTYGEVVEYLEQLPDLLGRSDDELG
jgi:hypothetical protein